MSQKKNGLENLVLISQLGINVVTPVVLCVAAGAWIDRKFGTSLVLPFLVLGVLSGALSAYKMAKRTIDKEKEMLDREREEQRKAWEERFGTGDGAGKKKRKGW